MLLIVMITVIVVETKGSALDPNRAVGVSYRFKATLPDHPVQQQLRVLLWGARFPCPGTASALCLLCIVTELKEA
jgi:hypothetical protein